MLDWRRVTQEPELFLKALYARGFSKEDAQKISSQIEKVSKKRVEVQKKADELKSERNSLSEAVAKLMKSGDKNSAQEKIARSKELGIQIENLEKEFGEVEKGFYEVLENVPNWPHESVPVGKDSTQNKVVREWGTKRKFSFTPQSHDEWGEKSGLLDFTRAAKLSGARFSFLRGPLAMLERALVNYMLETHRARGYEEIVPPYLVAARALYGTAQLPKFAADLFKISDHDLYLIPTSEVSLTNFFADEIIPSTELPKKFMAFSPCFRSEAGSYGVDTKGLIRQHQFHKVELVKFSAPEKSLEELETMVENAEAILKGLELPYRTVLLCTGDMGFQSRKTYDIEVWLPGSVHGASSQRGCYREISSCSDCGDFQSRRAKIRTKGKNDKGSQYVHTLNGSGLAVGRTLVAVLENYQQQDGSIEIPKALKPYMGGLERIPA